MAGKGHVPRVYVDVPLAVDATVELDADKRRHLAVVLRLGKDAPVTLFNGDGREYNARVDRAGRQAMTVTIESRHRPTRESPLDLTLVQAIARGDRMAFALAKAVELGVTRIQPVFTERGKVKLAGQRLDKKQAHWRKVVASAAEQSGRLICPDVTSASNLSDLIGRTDGDTHCLMLSPDATRGLADVARADRVALLVGPESGLSGREIKTAAAQGWMPITLGPRILRTETAGMAALAAIQTRWGDLSGLQQGA